MKKTRAKKGEGYRIVVPRALRTSILKFFHCQAVGGGHGGYRKTVHKICDRFTWQSIFQDIKSFIDTCDICQRTKYSNVKPAGQYFSKIERKPNSVWYLDTAGPYPSSGGGYKHVLVITDACSRFVMLEPLRSLSSKIICEKLQKLFLTFGYVNRIVHDRASIFMSAYFKQFLFSSGVTDVPTSAYSPSSNLCERQNRNIIQMLRCYIDTEQKQWVHWLPKIQYTLNLTVNDTLGMSAAEAYMGRKFINPLDANWHLNDIVC